MAWSIISKMEIGYRYFCRLSTNQKSAIFLVSAAMGSPNALEEKCHVGRKHRDSALRTAYACSTPRHLGGVVSCPRPRQDDRLPGRRPTRRTAVAQPHGH